VDVSNFKTHDWLKVGGGAVFLIAGFLPWLQISGFGFSVSANAFDFFFTGTVPWLIFVAIGVLTFLAAADIFKLPETFPAPTVFLGAAALGTLLVIIRFFDTEGGLDRGIGLFLALIAAIVVTAGSYMAFTESGGNLAELSKNLQSKTSSGTKTGANTGPGDDAPPPPPPPAN
jgi:hypothetical protein